jgi:hypothetical protein
VGKAFLGGSAHWLHGAGETPWERVQHLWRAERAADLWLVNHPTETIDTVGAFSAAMREQVIDRAKEKLDRAWRKFTEVADLADRLEDLAGDLEAESPDAAAHMWVSAFRLQKLGEVGEHLKEAARKLGISA